jgi:pSer/pThr/pTyr-binding forkhead associated (FHA) protein
LTSLKDQTYGTIDFSPNIGFFCMIAGYIAAVWGVIADHIEMLAPERQAPFPVDKQELKRITAESCTLELAQGNAPRLVQVENDRFFIGRGSGNDLILMDASVSRSHAVLRYAQGSWFIQDQQSKGGLFLNGKRVQASRLSEGDRIGIGGQVFIFHV